jgi:hypothetical protein
MGADAAGGCIQHGKVDGVAVRITSDDVVIVLCQCRHCLGPFIKLADTVHAEPGKQIIHRGNTVTGHALRRTSS